MVVHKYFPEEVKKLERRNELVFEKQQDEESDDDDLGLFKDDEEEKPVKPNQMELEK